jgi:hypothetical protein
LLEQLAQRLQVPLAEIRYRAEIRHLVLADCVAQAKGAGGDDREHVFTQGLKVFPSATFIGTR